MNSRFEWDENKNTLNKVKHSISFETASLVFDDANHKSILTEYVDGEERWQTIGMIGNVITVLVAHTYRSNDDMTDIIRIISARKATRQERRFYEKSY